MERESKDHAHRGKVVDEDRTGKEFGGRFRLIQRLGTGSTSMVYEAEDKRFQRRRMAVKVLGPEHTPLQLLRFKQEANIGAAPIHPSLVRVIDIGGIGGSYFIAMDLVVGTRFSTFLAEYGPFRWQYSVDMVQGLLDGLAALHAHGVVHCDVWPDNCVVELLLDNHPRIRLVDLGHAKIVEEKHFKRSPDLQDDPNRIYGTFAYIAPERFYVEDDYSVDVYAVGVLWYELLTGQAMPLPPCMIKMCGPECQDEPVGPPVSTVNLPFGLRKVLMTAVAPERADRYPDAATMLEALKEAVEAS